MKKEKYTVSQYNTSTILSWIQSGAIAIPEIQRPFVWKAWQVRDLVDSLYRGFPTGYLITWQNPAVKLKDGSSASGKKILIDGQQRVTALMAAILGCKVIDDNYKKINIRIAFNPLEDDGKFEVSNPAIQKDNRWIADISQLFSPDFRHLAFIKDYCSKNPGVDEDWVDKVIYNLKDIANRQIGVIDLASELDIETVTEVFIRINSKGKVLSQADFAMSKIAADEKYGGNMIRKCIDYFCHLAVAPQFYQDIMDNDEDFRNSEYMQQIQWLKNENDDLYDPDYSDMLRVAFMHKFGRGKLADLVSLLSGRDFETREYKEEISQQSFDLLKEGIRDYINSYYFNSFLLIIRSIGFISPSLISSQAAMNFAYLLYLTLKKDGTYSNGEIERLVQKWFVLSMLTGRYSGSAESVMDKDIKTIKNRDFSSFLQEVEEAELSDVFWSNGLVMGLETTSSISPFYNVYRAAQVKMGDKGLLSRNVTVEQMIKTMGDIHHIFPREYLKRNGFNKSLYNQVANFAYVQTEINIAIGSKAPNVYFADVVNQCNGGSLKYGAIDNMDELLNNLNVNCIPAEVLTMDVTQYSDFLAQRRVLMAAKIAQYYRSI